ncbi:MAG: hypothetical protein JXL80_02525 [Planctomycetes bacterium]|nr:hypothetical protein [Planctomycetota bacterium]
MRRTRAMLLMAGLLSAALSGCGPTMTSPQGYVRLKEPGWTYGRRFVSADGVYVGLRKPQPAEKGTLDFWVKAIENELTVGKGYTPVKSSELTSGDGAVGRCMDFAATVDDREMRYAVAVWVAGGRVVVAEAGGPKQPFDTDRALIEAALRGVTVR